MEEQLHKTHVAAQIYFSKCKKEKETEKAWLVTLVSIAVSAN